MLKEFKNPRAIPITATLGVLLSDLGFFMPLCAADTVPQIYAFMFQTK